MMRTRAERCLCRGQECLTSIQEAHTALPENEFWFRLAKEQEAEFWFRLAREREYEETTLERRRTPCANSTGRSPMNLGVSDALQRLSDPLGGTDPLQSQ